MLIGFSPWLVILNTQIDAGELSVSVRAMRQQDLKMLYERMQRLLHDQDPRCYQAVQQYVCDSILFCLLL
jgi:hypothetical protein